MHNSLGYKLSTLTQAYYDSLKERSKNGQFEEYLRLFTAQHNLKCPETLQPTYERKFVEVFPNSTIFL